MKNYIIVMALIAFFSCGDGSSEKTETNGMQTSNSAVENENKIIPNQNLQQNGDYSELFNRNPKNCMLMEAKEIATELQLSEDRSVFVSNSYGNCAFSLKLNDGSPTKVSFMFIEWDKKTIQKELDSFRDIESSFGADNDEGILVVSDTRDTNFGIRKARGDLFMLNPNYNGAILIRFGGVIEESTNKVTYTDAQKNERLNNAVTIANYLLKKYKK
ncbi:hypothetical protein SAMN03097699_0625 [Flavobacteriaceae bacterium MAR_2010_188]|nr:hypothetical protein SAMN03097699_0625 [Flavobacteriaceae bacterium MAR_2010_188]